MKKFLAILAAAALMLSAATAFAYQVKVDDDTFANVGAKAQIRLINSMPDPGDNEIDVALNQARLYTAGQVTNLVKFGINFDFTNTGAKANDGFIMLDFAKEAKLMAGIYRVAFSRVGLQDSYQYILIEGPAVINDVAPVKNSANYATYRGAGLTLWGDLMDGKLRYNFGIWDDDQAALVALGTDDKYALSGRVVFNLADPEKGYTCPGCYLGKANVMNIGLGYMMQDYNLLGSDKTAKAWTVDFFFDQAGATFEAGYVSTDYDTGVKPSGFYVEGAYMFGKVQPAARYESYDSDGGVDYDIITVGVNYLWDGHNAKFQLAYSMKDNDTGTDTDTLTAQLQIQF